VPPVSLCLSLLACTGPELSPTDTGSGELDLALRLAGIEGLQVTETTVAGAPYRTFALVLTQPQDHGEPAGPTFEQHLTLVHYDEALPMTMVSTGYADFLRDAHAEPTAMLGTNQVVVEKRYHGLSKPEPVDWTTMTLAQIAADQHEVYAHLSQVYGEPWLSTGSSMGGADAVYYRYHFPDDMAGTIAYAAPFQLEYGDERYPAWFETVPDAGCQEALQAVQIEMLGARRAEVVASLEAESYGYTTARMGGTDRALEAAMLSLPWAFWQYAGPEHCAWVPPPDAPLDDLVGFFWTYGYGLYFASDQAMDFFGPYYYQVQSQLGPPEVPREHLLGLIDPEGPDVEEGLLPLDAEPPAFVAANPPVVAWAQAEADRMILLYGELDPWTAGALQVGANPGVRSYTVAGGGHAVGLEDLPDAERDEAWDLVEDWLLP
jgi:hypothetical protein